jgi:RimJ/RimL family protein N-acetyltransferase
LNNIKGYELPAMLEAAKYSAIESLRDGRRMEIRALRPEDKTDMLGAIDRTSAQSLYRRFFGAKRDFSEKEIAFFLNIDFTNHVALVAVIEEEGGRAVIIAGGRYVAVRPGVAEVAFAVIDDYQGQGIGAALLRHLATIARGAGLNEFTAEVLPDNIAMLKVFEKSGLKFRTKREAGAVHVALQLA